VGCTSIDCIGSCTHFEIVFWVAGNGVLALLMDIIGSYWFRAGFLIAGSENKSWIDNIFDF
jgi:hypothetical protein